MHLETYKRYSRLLNKQHCTRINFLIFPPPVGPYLGLLLWNDENQRRRLFRRLK